MENYISQQLILFLRAALLGGMCAVAYDLLRAVRLRRSSAALLHLLDVVYVVSVLPTLFLFTLRQGEGEMRLYMMLALSLGMVLYFLVFAGIFRPIWWFWGGVLTSLLALLWKPAAIFLSTGKNFQIYIKKLFYFWCKYATIGK